MANNLIKTFGILAGAALVGSLIWNVVRESKAAELESVPGVVDTINEGDFDQYRLNFSNTVVNNMQLRGDTNVLLNEMYGGVPPVTVSDMTQYITGQMPGLQNLGRYR